MGDLAHHMAGTSQQVALDLREQVILKLVALQVLRERGVDIEARLERRGFARQAVLVAQSGLKVTDDLLQLRFSAVERQHLRLEVTKFGLEVCEGFTGQRRQTVQCFAQLEGTGFQAVQTLSVLALEAFQALQFVVAERSGSSLERGGASCFFQGGLEVGFQFAGFTAALAQQRTRTVQPRDARFQPSSSVGHRFVSAALRVLELPLALT